MAGAHQFASFSAHNPFVGSFHHAPSAGNRGSAFFARELMSPEEQERRKKIRHNPYTGVMYRTLAPEHRARQLALPGSAPRARAAKAKPKKAKPQLPRRAAEAPAAAGATAAAAAAAAAPRANKPRAHSFSTDDDPEHRQRQWGSAAELRELLRMPRANTMGDSPRLPSSRSTSEAGDLRQLRSRVKGVREAKLELRKLQRSLPRRVLLRRRRAAPSPPPPAAAPAAAPQRLTLDLDEAPQTQPRQSPRQLDLARKRASGGNPLISPAGSWLPQTAQAVSIQRQYSDSTTDGGGSTSEDESSPTMARHEAPAFMLQGALAQPYYVREMELRANYDVGDAPLGQGSFATVYAATHRATGRAVAVKAIDKRLIVSEEDQRQLVREIQLHARLKHKHVIRLFEVFETPATLSLVLELAGGSLAKLLQRKRRLPAPVACALAHQLLTAVSYLHAHGVLHSDIKPHNILLDEDPLAGAGGASARGAPIRVPQLKLCDFGLARKVPDARYYRVTRDVNKVPFTGMCGTEGYIAPELLREESYGKPADLWSVGVVVHEMLVGFTPFYPARRCLEKPVDVTSRLWAKVPSMARELIASLMEMDPARRPTAAQAMAHPWFEGALAR